MLPILLKDYKLARFGNVTVKVQFSLFTVLNKKADIYILAEFEALASTCFVLSSIHISNF